MLLDTPQDIIFDKNGYMYIADHANHRVQRFAPNSTIGVTVAGSGVHSNALFDLDHLTAMIVDDDFNIYILDIHNERVVKWAQNATYGTVLINHPNIDGTQDILFAPNSPNQVYISSTKNDAIYLWTFNASSPVLSLSAVNASINTLNGPAGMTLDPYGNLYVADTGNNRVVMYCANSTVGIVIATGTTPPINSPSAVAFDSNLNLYVVSTNSDRVMKFTRI